MKLEWRRLHWIWHVAIAVFVAAIWIVAAVPSGFGFIQLTLFAGPGILLAVGTSWAGHAFTAESWGWEDGFDAALLGAAVFPPLVALLFAWTSSFRDGFMVILFVVGAWLALGVGLVSAAVRHVIARRHPECHAVPTHLERLD